MSKKKFSKLLKGEKVTLKLTELSFDQAENDFKLMDKNRKFLLPRCNFMENMESPEDQFENLSYAVSQVKKGNRGDYSIYVGKSYVGNICVRLDGNDNDKSCEMFYRLDSDFYRKGYMKESIKLLEEEIFENHDINRIFVQIEKRNVNSIKLIESCGYIREGELREVYYSNYFKDFGSMIYFSKLRSEWK